jgi:hypothetical protein
VTAPVGDACGWKATEKKFVACYLKMLAAQVNIKNPALVVTLF